MQPLLSIIIPTYNCSHYIKRVLNSILKQDFDNYEVIIIDDGSTDNTKELLNQYKSSKIKVVYKTNSGVSDSRNKGISIAKGEYILFLDADDYIDKNYLKEIEAIIKKYPSVELINFAFYSDTENKEFKCLSSDKIAYFEKYYQNKTEIRNDFVSLWDNTMLYNIWNKVYLSKIIKENGIKFPNQKWAEDVAFNRHYINNINNLYNSSKAFYHYIREREGATSALYNNEFFNIRKKEYYDFNQYFNEWNIQEKEYIEFSSRRYIERILGCIENIYCGDISFKERYKKIKEIIKDETTKKALKVAKPKSSKTKVALIPLKLHTTLLTMLMGKIFHVIKNKYPDKFNKLKNRR